MQTLVIYLLEQANDYNGDYNDRPNYHIVGFTEKAHQAQNWVDSTPDNFTLRRYKIVSHMDLL